MKKILIGCPSYRVELCKEFADNITQLKTAFDLCVVKMPWIDFAREELFNICKTREYDYLFMLDDDNFFSGDIVALLKRKVEEMENQNKKVIAFGYRYKGEDKFCAGSFTDILGQKGADYQLGTGIVDWAGLGAVLIDAHIIRAMPQLAFQRHTYEHEGQAHACSDSLTFGVRVKQIGEKIYYDTKNSFGHKE